MGKVSKFTLLKRDQFFLGKDFVIDCFPPVFIFRTSGKRLNLESEFCLFFFHRGNFLVKERSSEKKAA